MSSKNHKPTLSKIADARKNGQYVRAKTWSKAGKDKCPKSLRREIKKHIQGY